MFINTIISRSVAQCGLLKSPTIDNKACIMKHAGTFAPAFSLMTALNQTDFAVKISAGAFNYFVIASCSHQIRLDLFAEANLASSQLGSSLLLSYPMKTEV